MTCPVVTFFNNKGGVGKTSLVYHIAWMLSKYGIRSLVADLDPQANLTAAFLEGDHLEELWSADPGHRKTVYGAISPLIRGVGDVSEAPHLEEIDEDIYLLAGDMDLSTFEDELSLQWPQALDRKERAFRVLSSFWRLKQRSARICEADLVLVDLGPNLGAINRTALIGSESIVFPLTPGLFSLQGVINSGPVLRRWREEWHGRLERNPDPGLELPSGTMDVAGYVFLQHVERRGRPVRAYQKWVERVPEAFHRYVLEDERPPVSDDRDDPACIGRIKNYQSLMPLSQDAGKPMFDLKAGDGAIGAHQQAVRTAYENFDEVTRALLRRVPGAEHLAEREG